MNNINNETVESCASSAGLVAYLYGEMEPAVQDLFENHLSGCDRCTDDFAEISFARLDVYEWNRDEFAPLETPQFAIPYIEAAVRASWLSGLHGYFASNREWAFAGGAFGLIAIIFAAWFTFSIARSGEISEVEVPEIHSTGGVPENDSRTNFPVVTAVNDKFIKADNPVSETARDKIETARTSLRKNSVRVAAVNRRTLKTAELIMNKPVLSRRSTAPRLNDFEDDEDNTLRLGDLLADVDSRR